MSTRLFCLACREWLARCKCQTPVPTRDEVRPLRSRPPYTRAEVAELLQAEAQEQEEQGRELVRDHQVKRRKPRA